MKKFLTSVTLLAVLAALILAGCGTETTPASSAPEGLATFGTLNPSAVPSTASMKPQTSDTNLAIATTTTPKPDGEPTVQTSSAPISPSPTKTPEPTATAKPTVKPTPTAELSPSPTPPEESPSPTPEPASTEPPEEAEKYIGKSADTLRSEIGLPGGGSDYEPVDENDPNSDEIGTLYYDGYTVTTHRTADGTETVTAVNRN